MWRIIMSKSDYTIRCITKGECADYYKHITILQYITRI